MKPSDFLNQLPSVNELLEHPQVQSVTDRLNRSVVATRVRGYLDQLTEEAKRRAADAEATVGAVLPDSMRDLVDRISRYLTKGDRWRVGAAINATGRFRGGPWVSTPLADAAVERIALSASDFTADPQGASENEATAPDAAAALCRATGASGAAVYNSRTSALWLALSSLPLGGEVVIARSDLTTLDDGCRVVDLIERAGLKLHEVGAVDTVTLDDYAGAANESTAAILRVAADDNWPAATHRIATNELSALAHQNKALLIEDLASAPLLDLPSDTPQVNAVIDGIAAPSLAAIYSAGADVVIARGEGLIGGPACGVAVGDTSAINQLQSTPLAGIVRVEPHIGAALAATIDLLSDRERFWFDSPLWSLLTTPLENLQTRAERLATQLQACDRLTTAEAVTLSAHEASATGLPVRLPTVAIAVSANEDAGESLASQLRGAQPSLWTREDDQRLLIDLRTVFPRQDGELVDALLRG